MAMLCSPNLRRCSASPVIEKHLALAPSFSVVLSQAGWLSLSFSPQADFTTWSTPPSSLTTRRCKLVSMTVLRLQKWARYLLPGSFWAMTAVMLAGWPMAASATLFLGQEGAAVLQRLPCASWASRIKSISCTGSIASEHTTDGALEKSRFSSQRERVKGLLFLFLFLIWTHASYQNCDNPFPLTVKCRFYKARSVICFVKLSVNVYYKLI